MFKHLMSRQKQGLHQAAGAAAGPNVRASQMMHPYDGRSHGSGSTGQSAHDGERDAQRQKAMRASKHHTRLVRTMRIAFPALGAFVIAFMLVPAGIRTLSIGPVSFDNIRFEDGALVMENPRLAGEDPDTGAYVVNALRAAQSTDNPQVVKLTEIDGNMGMEGDDRAQLSAESGVFDQDTEMLELSGNVQVTTESGYDFTSPKVYADMKNNVIETRNAINLKMLNGTVQAENLTVKENGELIVLDRVRIVTRMRPQD